MVTFLKIVQLHLLLLWSQALAMKSLAVDGTAKMSLALMVKLLPPLPSDIESFINVIIQWKESWWLGGVGISSF